MSEDKEEKSPVDKFDLKQKIRARDEKITELERLLEESKAKILSEDKFDWACQAWTLRQQIDARDRTIEALRKEIENIESPLKESVGETASRGRTIGHLRSQLNQKEKRIDELQKQNNLLREAAQAEDTGPDSKPELRMKVALLADELHKCEKKMMTSSLLRKMDELKNLAYMETSKRGGRLLYKDILERERESYQWCRDNETRLQNEICSLTKENVQLKGKLKEPLKLGIKDKNGVEMKEGDILKMPDGKPQVLSWGTEEKVFYGIGNTVTVVTAGFRIVFDGDFKASDCEIVGQSKIKLHREEM